MKSAEVLAALKKYHAATRSSTHAWIFMKELRLGTGWTHINGINPEQRIDAWVLHSWPSSGFISVSYEVKVTRRDFKREIAKPEKRAGALRVSNYLYFAVPERLVEPEEVPEEVGLVYVTEKGDVVIAKEAPWNKRDDNPTWALVASLCRSLLRGRQPVLMDGGEGAQ
ncbi:hypothetical protein LCGC14_1876520 [marine sediment metagenome]|uniref:Uncharacterized protein n=1 Tax=marine sediment metagenome TaxID=412755 RepID=A0A0F9G3I9_9ZZZZ